MDIGDILPSWSL